MQNKRANLELIVLTIIRDISGEPTPAITCPKLTKETLKHQWRRSGIFVVNSEHILRLALVFLLLSLSR